MGFFCNMLLFCGQSKSCPLVSRCRVPGGDYEEAEASFGEQHLSHLGL